MMPPSGEKNLTLHSSGKILNLLYKKTPARIPVMSHVGPSQFLWHQSAFRRPALIFKL